MIVCVAIWRSLIFLHREVSTQDGEAVNEKLKTKYRFYGSDIEPNGFSEHEVKLDILSKLPTYLRQEVEENLTKTKMVEYHTSRVERRGLRVDGSPAKVFQVFNLVII